jgi:hypothetical protein
MNYLQKIAAEIRNNVPEDALPKEDTSQLFLIYAVLLLARGDDVSRADVHNAWAAWMSTRSEDHESIVPFSELPPETQAQDSAFMIAIRAAARARSLKTDL